MASFLSSHRCGRMLTSSNSALTMPARRVDIQFLDHREMEEKESGAKRAAAPALGVEHQLTTNT